MGFYTLILLAGLQSIPPDLYEAGDIDGANAWDSFRFITMPMLMPTLFVVLVLSVIRAVQIFDHVYVLTNGGPGSATLYIVQYIYTTAFQNRNYGLAAAASLLLALVLLTLTVIQLRLGRRAEAA
jgi:alpha-1,4-digalacturonate transport system permease protein